jgi:hypothetical protein
MTLAQFAEIIAEWSQRITPAQVKSAASSITTCVLEWPIDITVEEALRRVGAPAEVIAAEPPFWLRQSEAIAPPQPRRRRPRGRERLGGGARYASTCEEERAHEVAAETVSDPDASPRRHGRNGRAGVGERAQVLVRDQLKHGPVPETWVFAAAEAAEIPERSLIAAASVLRVRTQRGQWWLPEVCFGEAKLPGQADSGASFPRDDFAG